jgi:hypothetical protein
MEKIYPENIKPEWQQGVIDMAKRKASELAIPLVTLTKETGRAYPTPQAYILGPVPKMIAP